MNWHSRVISGAGKSVEEKRAAEQTREFMDSLSLTQVVNGPTRGESLLDLVLTNNIDLIHNCTISDSEISDHKVVTLGLPQCTADESTIWEHRFAAMNFFRTEFTGISCWRRLR